MIQEWIHKKVIWVKSSGLWGSIWSKAITGSTPNIAGNLFLGLYYIIANGIFFLPKREVTISFYDITKDTYLWSLWDRRSFNRHLEHFYNQNITPAKYIPHYFYYDDTRRISSKKLWNPPSENDSDTAHVSDKDIDSYDVFVELKDIIGKIKQKDISHLEWNTHLIADLEMDSLDMMELKTWVQKRFPQASNPEIQSLKILEDVWRMAAWVSSAKLPRRWSSLIMYRWFLRAFDWYTIWILLDQERWNDFVHILASLGKNGIPIPCTQNEEDFNRVFQEIDSGRIITSKAHYHSIRSSWFAKYEHNIIFIEDIKSRKTLENLKLLLLGLMPPYGK